MTPDWYWIPNILMAPFFVYVFAVCLYLLAVTLAAYTVRPAPQGNSRRRVGVVIPAHNERDHIPDTVAAVFTSEYPAELLKAYVLADNCTDYTAAAARQAGAIVYERHDPAQPGKGYALDWLFRHQREILRDNDTIIIIDADSIIDATFISAGVAALQRSKSAAVQGNNEVANPRTNWRTALTYAGFSLINCVRPAGRWRLGGTAGLQGNGMIFDATTLAKYGWPAHSLVEDVEFSINLLLDGRRTAFEPAARISSDMPAGRRQANCQRRRWDFGRIEFSVRTMPVLLRALLKKRRWRYAEAIMDLAVPPLSILVVVQALLLAATPILSPIWLYVLGFTAAATVFHVFSGLILGRAPLAVWLALTTVPAFIAWKLLLYVSAIFRPPEHIWVRTPRESQIHEHKKQPTQSEVGK